MSQKRRHTWLFSFTDTAFLLLLVYTQFGRLDAANNPVAEMKLDAPVVVKNSELRPVKEEPNHQQVLVDKHSDKPYLLTTVAGGNETSRSRPLSFRELEDALQACKSERARQPRPVVVPLPESFSSDLVQAAALVGKIWNEGGSVVVHTQKEVRKS